MPMIDSEKLKPGSDAAQSAKLAWRTAVDTMSNHDRADYAGYALAVERAQVASEVYNDLAHDLATEVYYLIADAGQLPKA